MVHYPLNLSACHSGSGNLRQPLARLGKLRGTAFRPCASIREDSAGRADRQEVVENDADPFDAIDVEQHSAPRLMDFTEAEPSEHPCREPIVMGERHGHFGLTEKIADELCRVVSSSIFEVHEHDATSLVNERVVEAEVGRRDANLLGLEPIVK